MTGSGAAAVVPMSVVISTLNRPHTLARCLDALLSGTRLPTEIVVVDQGDAAVTEAVLRAHRDTVVTLAHVTQPRRGLSASQNAGVERATCPVVSIVDDDCVPDTRWLEVAAAGHAAASGPLVIGGRVLALPAVGDRAVPLALRESTARVTLSADGMPWDLGTGGNFSVTRDSYRQVGGNDERLGTGTPGRAGNDVDLFRRLMRAGVEARFEPDMLVRHERATPAEYRSRSWTYGFGIGACIALWMADGDRWALRVLAEWVKMRVRLLAVTVRRRRSVTDELRVMIGTVHGFWYGRRLPPRGTGGHHAAAAAKGARRSNPCAGHRPSGPRASGVASGHAGRRRDRTSPR
jgi:GT2 family glycosyltransferase